MTQWSTLTLRATLSGSISPRARTRNPSIRTSRVECVRAILVRASMYMHTERCEGGGTFTR